MKLFYLSLKIISPYNSTDPAAGLRVFPLRRPHARHERTLRMDVIRLQVWRHQHQPH